MFDLLQSCRDLVARGWCRDADGRDVHGRAVNPSSPDARAWSVAGALAAARSGRAGKLPGALISGPWRRR